MLTEAEKRRYRRQIMLPGIGEEGQLKLKNARVLVVGAGGLGCPVLQYLTAAGVGTLGIMDFDMVNEDNLHRQVLYGGHDLGRLKTIIARDRLQALNPLVKHEVYNIRLNETNASKFVTEYDLVVDATDNFTTRYLIDQACKEAQKPWVYGSVFMFEGQVSVFRLEGGPGLEDAFPGIQDKVNVPDPEEYGLTGILPGIIGSFQANEVIRIITGIGEPLSGKLLQYDMRDHSICITRI